MPRSSDMSGFPLPAATTERDPYWAYVTALYHFDAYDFNLYTVPNLAVGSTVPSLTCEAASFRLSVAQKKFGYASLLNASNQWFGTPSTTTYAELGFGTGDFTVELFSFRTSTGGSYQMALDMRPSGVSGNYVTLCAGYSGAASTLQILAPVISGGTIVNNTWQHIAYCRAAGMGRLFLEGAQQGADTADANSYPNSRITLGQSGYDHAAWGYAGHIDALRITKGIARYTTSFAPPLTAFPTA